MAQRIALGLDYTWRNTPVTHYLATFSRLVVGRQGVPIAFAVTGLFFLLAAGACAFLTLEPRRKGTGSRARLVLGELVFRPWAISLYLDGAFIFEDQCVLCIEMRNESSSISEVIGAPRSMRTRFSLAPLGRHRIQGAGAWIEPAETGQAGQRPLRFTAPPLAPIS